MSTLTDKIAATLEAHVFDKPIGLCRCNAAMSTTGHRTGEHRAHLAEVVAAVVAEWLASPEAIAAVSTAILGRTATVGTARALASLAAEAVKGAGQ